MCGTESYWTRDQGKRSRSKAKVKASVAKSVAFYIQQKCNSKLNSKRKSTQNIDGLEDCGISNALAMEIPQSYTKPLLYLLKQTISVADITISRNGSNQKPSYFLPLDFSWDGECNTSIKNKINIYFSFRMPVKLQQRDIPMEAYKVYIIFWQINNQ